MKTLQRFLLAALVLGLFATPAMAQTYNASTTLSTAITTRNQTIIAVASVSGWVCTSASPLDILIDGELMRVATGQCGTAAAVVVSRGAGGSPAQLHSASSVVFWGPPSMFTRGDTDNAGNALGGACTASNYPFLPLINFVNGNVWLCRATSGSAPTNAAQWTATNSRNITYNSLLKNLQ